MNAEETLILAKSLALIERTKQRVAQIDSSNFPTDSSEIARKLLVKTLDVLGTNAASPAVSPEALYNALIRFQGLVEDVESSTSEHVSWPLVSYCHHVWKALFSGTNSQIFYSVTNEHNYTISSFSARLRILLNPVLPVSEIDALLGKDALYCLQLASLEEENLPLYANIGHEFGHAVWWANEADLLKIFVAEINAVYNKISSDLKAVDAHAAARRLTRTVLIVKSIATELFCDLMGLVISGPAFVLSLQEMSWGSDATRWTGRLLPKNAHITGYPSFRFRLHCLKSQASLKQYEADAIKAFQGLPTDELKKIGTHLSGLSSDHASDSVAISPDSDPDRASIEAALLKNLGDLKQALEKFVARCETDFLPPLRSKPEFGQVSADHVTALLQRLEANILPNIIPDGSLLGTPATFSAILNASALYRIAVLQRGSTKIDADRTFRDLQKVERLTAKAFEVSYIQRDFGRWQVATP